MHTLVSTGEGHVLGVHSWADGFTPIKCTRKPVNQDTVLELAVRLERRGLRDEAEYLLDRFLGGFRLELG